MNVLLIDTSTSYCTATLAVDDYFFNNVQYLPMQHNNFLLDIVNSLIVKSGIDKHNIDLLAYGIGPGSFTGIRLSASLIYAIALVINKPVLGFSSMHAIATSVRNKLLFISSTPITIILHAMRGYAYLGQYRTNTFSNNLVLVFEKCVSVKYLLEFLINYDCGILVGNSIENVNIDFDVINFYPDVKDLFFDIKKQYYDIIKKENCKFDCVFPIYHSYV